MKKPSLKVMNHDADVIPSDSTPMSLLRLQQDCVIQFQTQPFQNHLNLTIETFPFSIYSCYFIVAHQVGFYVITNAITENDKNIYPNKEMKRRDLHTESQNFQQGFVERKLLVEHNMRTSLTSKRPQGLPRHLTRTLPTTQA